MKPIVFHPEASRDASDAVDYLELQWPGLGEDFRVELSAALLRIQRNPALYAIETGRVRACPFHRFSYCLYYVELADRIWVAAVGHQSRRPGYWSRRRPI